MVPASRREGSISRNADLGVQYFWTLPVLSATGTIQAHLGVLHAFLIGVGYSPVRSDPLSGFGICAPIRLTITGIPNAPETFGRPCPGPDGYPLTRTVARFIDRFGLERVHRAYPP